jgi:uncharacterized tellurite resistance protein B-like protein
LAALYSSASGTFTSEILPKDFELPDVMRLSEPLTTARRLFESCSAQLEAYSRELGRANGLEPNLSTLAHLPLELRNIAGGRLSGAPLSALAEFATKGAPIDPGDFARAVGLGKAGPKDIGELREWARILEAFGFGVTSDPLFALRRPTPQTPFVVFSLGAAADNRPAPTESFRTMQMTVAVAIMVALADGVFSPEEEEALARLIDGAPGLEEMERRRLRAEARAHAADPLSLTDLRARLKRTPVDARRKLAADIVEMAGADNRIEPKEVSFIERFFRQLDLDASDLYGRLHGAVASRETSQGEDDGARRTNSSGLDSRRLAAIRAETAGAASMLSEIFADDEDGAPAPPTAPVAPAEPLADTNDDLDGLDRRHRLLLEQLSDRDEWPRPEFDRLARSVELMPGAALDALNDWALERFEDLLLEGDDPIVVNAHLLSLDLGNVTT